MNHVTRLAHQIPQGDPVTVLLRVWAIMTQKNYDQHSYRSYQARMVNVLDEPDDYESESLLEVESE